MDERSITIHSSTQLNRWRFKEKPTCILHVTYISHDNKEVSKWLIFLKDGFCHRRDGPAVINKDGSVMNYYIADKYLSFKEWLPLSSLSDEEKALKLLEL